MATIADISSGDFVYNTFDYRDPKKVGPAAWTTVYLLNLKPTDYIISSNAIRNNIFQIVTGAQGQSKNKVELVDVNSNAGQFLNKVQSILGFSRVLFRLKSKNGWTKWPSGGPQLDIAERVDEIEILQGPIAVTTSDRPRVGTYEDYTLTPSKLHNVYRFKPLSYDPTTLVMSFKKNVPNSQSTKMTQFDQIDPTNGNFIPNPVSIIICQYGRSAEVKLLWESALSAQKYESVMYEDTIDFAVDPHTGVITTWVTVTTGQSTQIGQAATTASLTEAITGKIYDISAAATRLEAEEKIIKAELQAQKTKLQILEAERIRMKQKDKDLDSKDAQLDQKDVELKQEIDTKVDQTWIDERMKDISAIEIHDQKQQQQIDTSICFRYV